MGYYSVWKKDTSKQALYTCIVESVADNFKAVKGNGKAIPRGGLYCGFGNLIFGKADILRRDCKSSKGVVKAC